MKLFFSVMLLFVSLGISLSGCGPKAPADMPKVYPCKVTVSNAGKPVDEAVVQLVSKDNTTQGSFTVSGTTNESGVAEIVTAKGTYATKGAPEGDYIVTIRKEPVLEHEISSEELAQMERTKLEKYMKEFNAKRAKLPKPVPESFFYPSKTPLKMQVTTSGAELDVKVEDYEKK